VALAQEEESGGSATEQPRVYVVAVPMEASVDVAAARVGAAARSTLRGIDTVRWQEADRAFVNYEDELEALQRGRDRVRQGQQSFLELEYDRAIEAFSGAVRDFDSAAGILDDASVLGEALLYLGASQVFAGNDRGAARTFRRLHVQMPTLQPDPNVFSPRVVQRYGAAAPRDARNPRGEVVIESEPTDVDAHVDFVPRGRTPVTVDGLLAGPHILRLVQPGATPTVERVEVGRRSRTVTLVSSQRLAGLPRDIAALSDADVDRMHDHTPLGRVADLLELDALIVIRVSPKDRDQVELELLVFNASNGERLLRSVNPQPRATGSLEAGVHGLISDSLDAVLRQRAVVPGSGQDGQRPTGPTLIRPPDEKKIYEEPLFWVGVGAAVAAGVVVSVLIATAGDSDAGSQFVLEF